MSHCAGQRYQPPARTYYVDATGGGANPGNAEHAALQTLVQANALVLKPGDRVLFKRGETWNENLSFTPTSSGKPGRHIIYGDYGAGALPSLVHDDGAAVFISNQHDIMLKNLAMTTTTGTYAMQASNGAAANRLDNFYVDGCTGNGGTTGVIMVTVSVANQVSRVFYLNCTVTGTLGPSGIGVSDATVNGVYIDGCTSYGNGDNVNSDHGIYSSNVNDITVRNCTAYSNVAAGIKVRAAQGVRILRNHCYGNNDGIIYSDSDFGLVANNLCYDNNNTGIYIVENGDNCNFFHNTLVNNKYNQIIFLDAGPGMTGNVFKNNIIVADDAMDVSWCMRLDGDNIANNTWDNNLWVHKGSTACPNMVYQVGGSYMNWSQWQTAACSPDANSLNVDPLFLTVTSTSTTVDADSAAGQKVLNVTATTGFEVGWNISIGEGTTRGEGKVIDTIQDGVSLTMTVNLSAAHSAANADAVIHRVYSDYHLQASSSAIGNGASGLGVLTDYDGVVRASPPAIGAYEYVA